MTAFPHAHHKSFPMMRHGESGTAWTAGSSCGGHMLYFGEVRVTNRALRFMKDIEVLS
ncbi:MAG: hypothetical protein PVI24_16840 [Myxococcales bacterium]